MLYSPLKIIICFRGKGHFGFHALRRFYASQIMGTGLASVKDVSDLLGHSSARNTEKYLRMINPNLWGLVDQIDDN